MAEEVLKLKDLKPEEVPEDLRYETYFDFKAHPFAHQALLEETKSVYDAILGIGDYTKKWLEDAAKATQDKMEKICADACCSDGECKGRTIDYKLIGRLGLYTEGNAVFEPERVIASDDDDYMIMLADGVKVIGGVFYIDKGSIYIGEGSSIEPGVGIKGPAIVGKNTEIRTGSYLRGDTIMGDDCVIRGELKNAVMMNKGNFPHPSYLGDSLAGYMTHFGNQVTAANLGIYEGTRDSDKRKPLIVRCNGKGYDFGKPKMGVCLGDFSQIGCTSVTDPGTFIKPWTIVYPLSRITKGFYGPKEVLKNKPLEHGIIERAPLTPLQ